MAEAFECPLADSWPALLEQTLPPEEERRCEEHLEACPVCRARLDDAQVGESELLALVGRVGAAGDEPLEPALAEAVSRLQGEDALDREAQPGPPPVFSTVGDYEVHEVLGRGGMGVVLKAYDPALHRVVALKVMPPALAGSATARRRFTREAQAAAAVCHDHVVAIYGVHEADGLPYLVMQYLPGGSLQDRLDRAGPLSVEDAVRVGWETALGLAAAHAQGLIHRDIKPANLLEDELGRVKITDFGLARMVDDVRLTQSGVIAGTPEYMAPEQARGEPVDPRADLFSLGSVLYALCAGVPPFRGPALLAVLRRVNEEEPAPLRELRPDVPPWLEAFIARLMAKDPARRFQSASEVAALLAGYLEHLRRPEQAPPPAPLLLSQGDPDMVVFSCAGCGARVKARPDLAGKRARCPKCAGAMCVPPERPARATPPGRGSGRSAPPS